VGFKQDLAYHSVINREKALDFVKGHRLIGFIEVSSKEGFNLDVPIKSLIQEILHVKNRHNSRVNVDVKCAVNE
jgi:hypothetical protein